MNEEMRIEDLLTSSASRGQTAALASETTLPLKTVEWCMKLELQLKVRGMASRGMGQDTRPWLAVEKGIPPAESV